MKLVIIPNFHTRYDVEMISGLSNEFIDLGITNNILISPVDYFRLNHISKSSSFDCVISK